MTGASYRRSANVCRTKTQSRCGHMRRRSSCSHILTPLRRLRLRRLQNQWFRRPPIRRWFHSSVVQSPYVLADTTAPRGGRSHPKLQKKKSVITHICGILTTTCVVLSWDLPYRLSSIQPFKKFLTIMTHYKKALNHCTVVLPHPSAHIWSHFNY